MQESYRSVELDATQTELVCRGLLDLAAVDGVDPAELAMIEDFFAQSGGGARSLDSLAALGFDPGAAAAGLTGAARDTFFISCYMLMYADGAVSDLETQRMAEFGEAFGVDAEQLSAYDIRARQLFLGMMAEGLRNKDAVQQVGAELGLTADQIAQATEG